MCRSDFRKHSFLSFPGEIRNQIYSYLFDDQVLKIDYKPKSNNKITQPRLRTLRFDLHLLLTCRSIEKEVDGFIFDKSTFSFHSDQALWKFAGMVSDANLARIQKLSLDIVLFSFADMSKWHKAIEMVMFKNFNGLQYVNVDLQSGSLTREVDAAACLRQCAVCLKWLRATKKGRTLNWSFVSSFLTDISSRLTH